MNRKLKDLVQRAEHWPEPAQEELARLGEEIEGELRGGEYEATQEELRAIDEAIAEIERGEKATKRKSKRCSRNSAPHDRLLFATCNS